MDNLNVGIGNVGQGINRFEGQPIMGGKKTAPNSIKELDKYLEMIQFINVKKGKSKLIEVAETDEQGKGKTKIITVDTKRSFFGKPGTSEETQAAYTKILNTALKIIKAPPGKHIYAETDKANQLIKELADKDNTYAKNIMRRNPELRKQVELQAAHQKFEKVKSNLATGHIKQADGWLTLTLKDKDFLRVMKSNPELRKEVELYIAHQKLRGMNTLLNEGNYQDARKQLFSALKNKTLLRAMKENSSLKKEINLIKDILNNPVSNKINDIDLYYNFRFNQQAKTLIVRNNEFQFVSMQSKFKPHKNDILDHKEVGKELVKSLDNLAAQLDELQKLPTNNLATREPLNLQAPLRLINHLNEKIKTIDGI